MTLQERCLAIELILSDVDGVLTDGGIIYDEQGTEIKRFNVRDGLGIKLWRKTGRRFGIITARTSAVVQLRAAQLGIEIVRQGAEDKLAAAIEIVRDLNLTLEQVCYLGDDLPDVRLARHVRLAVAVPDACEEMRSAAHFVTTLAGGHGAVRQTIEMILKAQRRWDELTRGF